MIHRRHGREDLGRGRRHEDGRRRGRGDSGRRGRLHGRISDMDEGARMVGGMGVAIMGGSVGFVGEISYMDKARECWVTVSDEDISSSETTIHGQQGPMTHARARQLIR